MHAVPKCQRASGEVCVHLEGCDEAMPKERGYHYERASAASEPCSEALASLFLKAEEFRLL